MARWESQLIPRRDRWAVGEVEGPSPRRVREPRRLGEVREEATELTLRLMRAWVVRAEARTRAVAVATTESSFGLVAPLVVAAGVVVGVLLRG